MTGEQYEKDIVFLVADTQTKFALIGLISRHQSIQIKSIPTDKFDIYTHPEQDSGCLLHSHTFLRQFINQYAYSIVIFDRDGCGREHLPRQSLEQDVENLLSINGWGKRTSVIVIDPELEIWVWSDSPHVDELLGWGGRQPDLRTWLTHRGSLIDGEYKPNLPKEAMEAALKEARKPRSSSIYQQLAQRVSLARCIDPAFIKLRTTLQNWFPLD
jgi:hypothetical protein